MASCMSATAVRVELFTDGELCTRSVATTSAGVFAGPPGAVDRTAPRAVASGCTRDMGSITVVRSGAGEAFDVEIAMSMVGDAPTECAKKPASCVVARRRVTFVSHTTLQLPIHLDARCIGVECSDVATTCFQGRCVPAAVTCDDASCRLPIEGPSGDVDASAPAEAGPTDGGVVDAPADARPGDRVTQLVAGEQHTCALFASGAVKCWGRNDSGQLGVGDAVARGTIPSKMGSSLPAVALGKAAKLVAAGHSHTCAVLVDDTLRCWGDNSIGQLGLGDTVSRGASPSDFAPLAAVDFGARRVVEVGTGTNHTCALLDDGKPRCWGGNGSGQLGLGDTSPRGGSAVSAPKTLSPVDVGSIPVSSVVVGHAPRTCALGGGTLKCWGGNGFGELGLGNTVSYGAAAGQMGGLLPPVDVGGAVQEVAIGSYHSCALRSDQVFCWGTNGAGQLGIGTTSSPIGDEVGEMGATLGAVALGQSAKRVAAGTAHSCALLGDGTVKCWGSNGAGQLGVEDLVDRLSPGPSLALDRRAIDVVAGNTHTCALLDDGTVKCWGGNEYGQCGTATSHGGATGTMGAALPPVDLGQ